MLRSHLLLAWRVLLRRKAFTAVSLFTIAATLLVVTTASALLQEMFGNRPPESRLERAVGVLVLGMYGEHRGISSGAGYGFLDGHLRDLPGVEETTFFSFPAKVASYAGDRKQRLTVRRTDGAFWRVFDFRFLEGGPIRAEHDRDHEPVVVINAATRDRLLGTGEAVGRTIELDGRKFRVVGVVANVPSARLLVSADVWMPISATRGEAFRDEYVGDFHAVFLAASADDLPAIQAEVDRRIRLAKPPERGYDELHGGADTKFEAFSRLMFSPQYERAEPGLLRAILMTLGVGFMLLPAVNLTNLNLSRIAERASEIGVRRAFGARRRSLVGQFLLESVMVSLAGGAIGFLLAALALGAINRAGLVPYADFRLDLAVGGWTLAAATLFGLLSGVWPAWRMSRLAPATALAGGSR
jgi:putative ABC transport system permease protein